MKKRKQNHVNEESEYEESKFNESKREENENEESEKKETEQRFSVTSLEKDEQLKPISKSLGLLFTF